MLLEDTLAGWGTNYKLIVTVSVPVFFIFLGAFGYGWIVVVE